MKVKIYNCNYVLYLAVKTVVEPGDDGANDEDGDAAVVQSEEKQDRF